MNKSLANYSPEVIQFVADRKNQDPRKTARELRDQGFRTPRGSDSLGDVHHAVCIILRNLPAIELTGEELSEWISDWAVDHGSAVELWGGEKVHKAIYNAVRDRKKLKTVQSASHRDRLLAKGWTLIGEEWNYDSYDAVLVKGSL